MDEEQVLGQAIKDRYAKYNKWISRFFTYVGWILIAAAVSSAADQTDAIALDLLAAILMMALGFPVWSFFFTEHPVKLKNGSSPPSRIEQVLNIVIAFGCAAIFFVLIAHFFVQPVVKAIATLSGN